MEVTSQCNAKCTFCAYRLIAPTIEHTAMSFEIFKRAVDGYIENGGLKVSFTATIGDPLLDRGLIEKIEYALSTKKLENVYMITNGIRLNKGDYYKKIVDTGINSILISLACFEKNTWERIYGVKAYDTFLLGVSKLLKYNNAHNNPIKIKFLFRSPYLPSKTLKTHDFIKIIKPHVFPYVSYDFMSGFGNWGGAITNEDMFGFMTMRKVRKMYKIPCRRLFDSVILTDGSVRLCGCKVKVGHSEHDELVVGNINKDNILKICHNKKSESIRAGFVNGTLPPICVSCNEYMPIDKKYLNTLMLHKS